jgi:hypothetical protein
VSPELVAAAQARLAGLTSDHLEDPRPVPRLQAEDALSEDDELGAWSFT